MAWEEVELSLEQQHQCQWHVETVVLPSLWEQSNLWSLIIWERSRWTSVSISNDGPLISFMVVSNACGYLSSGVNSCVYTWAPVEEK